MKSMVEIFVVWVSLDSWMLTVVGLVIHSKAPSGPKQG